MVYLTDVADHIFEMIDLLDKYVTNLQWIFLS